MTTVFLSGSRHVSRLNDLIRERIQNMVDKRLDIVVGDANGADKAMQSYLAEKGYPHVTVYCAGVHCRNNVGHWTTQNISSEKRLTGREFYAQKDRAMAGLADFGFVLWDGKSAGSIGNVLELLSRGKKVVLFHSPDKTFYNISSLETAKTILDKCDPKSLEAIYKKTNLGKMINLTEGVRQTTFASF